MALIALLASVAMPLAGRSTGAAGLRTVALDVAGLLRQARFEAMESGSESSFRLDTAGRIASAGGRSVAIPADIRIRHEISTRCQRQGETIIVVFLADGRSCGSQLTLEAGGQSAIIQTNWLAGKSSVRFVPGSRT